MLTSAHDQVIDDGLGSLGNPRGWCERFLSGTLIRAHPVLELCGRLECSPDRSHRWWRLLRCFFRGARPICPSSCQKLTLISCGISHELRRVNEYPWESIWKRKEEKRTSRRRSCTTTPSSLLPHPFSPPLSTHGPAPSSRQHVRFSPHISASSSQQYPRFGVTFIGVILAAV